MVSLKVWNGSALKDPDMIIAKGSTDTLFEVNYVVVNNSSQNPVTVWQAISQTTRSTTTTFDTSQSTTTTFDTSNATTTTFSTSNSTTTTFNTSRSTTTSFKPHLGQQRHPLIPLGQRQRRLIRQGLQAEPQAGLTRRIMFKPMRRIMAWSPSLLIQFFGTRPLIFSIGQAGMALVERQYQAGATHIR